MDEIIKVVERFYTRLYASDVSPAESTKRTSLAFDVLLVSKEEVEKGLQALKRAKAAGDGLTVDLSKERGRSLWRCFQHAQGL